MFDKKKLNFWRLAFIFGGIIIITLFSLRLSPEAPKASMMTESMGNNMKSMHLSNITIYDLIKESGMSGQMKMQMDNHHNPSRIIYNMAFLSTSIIYLLLPLIIGGTIILTIVWLK